MDCNLLLSFPIFSGFDSASLNAVLEDSEVAEFEEKREIVKQGENSGGFFIVLEGSADSYVHDPNSGLNYEFEHYGKGDFFGEASAFFSKPETATVENTSPLKALKIKGRGLGLLGGNNRIYRVLCGLLLNRIAHLNNLKEGKSVNVFRLRIDPQVFLSLPQQVISKNRVIPFLKTKSQIVVGMVEPWNAEAIEDIRKFVKGAAITALHIPLEDFERFFRWRILPFIQATGAEPQSKDQWFKKALMQPAQSELEYVDPLGEAPAERISKQIPGEQVVALVNQLIGEALRLDASDIHIEPTESELVVRYRVDGRLKKRPAALPLSVHSPLVSRFKVLARMDIAERRKPQDGHITTLYKRREIDYRLATIPSRFGEKLVLRILDPASILIQLNVLITSKPQYETVKSLFDAPSGMVIVSGPTGSGKTTTIYSALLRRREEEVNIITIEDPIEYTIDGITQVQHNPVIHMSFPEAIRNFLRQDPDIIVVGETRDPQTARAAFEAALTGHLVLTTLHANDSIQTVLRLREMGIEPFLIANSVQGVIAQRLVRKICRSCRIPAHYHEDIIVPLELDLKPEGKYYNLFRGKGCPDCNFQGFKGRVGVFEVLKITDEIRPVIAACSNMNEIRDEAVRRDLYYSLRNYCSYLLSKGLTTPEEVMRILFA
ncbi:MAG: Flp pilus assembly complex ATPase component TadA [Deltaproteobacteria bacterium]|nr:Flp pilus assembly complex ATPase component TadA [Deltaproteobacteria bacterium]